MKVKFVMLAILLSTLGARTAAAATVNLEPVADATIAYGRCTQNDGLNTRLFNGFDYCTGANDEVFLMRFDLSGIPPGAIITSASLQLYCQGYSCPRGSGIPCHWIYLRRIVQSWSESTVTYCNSPSPDSPWLFQSAAICGAGAVTAASPALTAVVQGWVATPSANFGLWVANAYENATNAGSLMFNSRQATSNRPQLTVTYSCPAPTAPVAMAPCGTVLAPGSTEVTTRWRRAANATSYYVELYANETCSGTPAQSSSLTDTTKTFQGLGVGTYSWRVVALNQACGAAIYSDWSGCCGFTVPPAPQTFAYTSFDGPVLTLYVWEGANVVYLTRSNALSPAVMSSIVAATDAAYQYYQFSTGYTPWLCRSYHGKLTIADVPSTCGAGCGYVGCTGIELQNANFDALYAGVRDSGAFRQEVFYELGRNFWHLTPQLEYLSPDSGGTNTTGFAVLMRFLSMESAGVIGAPFNGWTFSDFRSRVEAMVDLYAADPTQTWWNTLRVGLPQANNPSGLGATDLLASFLLRIRRDSGKSGFYNEFWKRAALLPPAATTQDAVDNFFRAACGAANLNLTSLFETTWRWPLSVAAKASVGGYPSDVPEFKEATLELSPVFPNPTTTGVQLRYSIPGNTAVPVEGDVYNLLGQRVADYDFGVVRPGRHEWTWNCRDPEGIRVPAGIYFLRLRTPMGARIARFVISR